MIARVTCTQPHRQHSDPRIIPNLCSTQWLWQSGYI